jgi:ABC-type sugar transport system ATPase subunit
MNFLPGAILDLDVPWIGVRPEALSVPGSRAQDAATVRLSGVVSHVEDLGADSYVHVRLNGDAAQHEITIKTAGAVPCGAGSHIDLSACRDALHLFDETGRALTSMSATH